MFSQISSTDLNKYFLQYKSLMCSLTIEKDPPEEIAKKTAKTRELANQIFIINDNDITNIEKKENFKTKATDYIDKLCSIKPGRKLVKAIAKSNEKISILSHTKSIYGNKIIKIGFGPKEAKNYNTINLANQKTVVNNKPKWITFAHEVIHALHDINSRSNYELYSSIKRDILSSMDNLEEQHTIIGFNLMEFIKKNDLTYTDILCENAFLLAIKLPPRVDHLCDDFDCKPLFEEGNHDELRQVYYSWLENEIRFMMQIPEEKKKDKEYLVEFLNKYPSAINSLNDLYKEDEKFISRLIHIDFLQHFPILCRSESFILETLKYNNNSYKYASTELFNSENFTLEVITFNIDAYRCISPELFKNKSFIIKLINKINVFGTSKMIKDIENKMEDNLKNDPFIMNALQSSIGKYT